MISGWPLPRGSSRRRRGIDSTKPANSKPIRLSSSNSDLAGGGSVSIGMSVFVAKGPRSLKALRDAHEQENRRSRKARSCKCAAASRAVILGRMPSSSRRRPHTPLENRTEIGNGEWGERGGREE